MGEATVGAGGGGEDGDRGAIQFPAFPFKPYPIQLDFMRAVYGVIQKGGVAIIESPTGTGKTLSLICSALQWLVDHHQQQDDSSTSSALKKTDCLTNGTASEDTEPDWMSNYELQNGEELRRQKGARKWVPKSTASVSLGHVRKGSSSVLSLGGGGEKKGAQERKKGESAQGKPSPSPGVGGVDDDDEQFLVEDYCSDEESTKDPKRKLGSSLLSSSSSGEDTDDGEEAYEPLKVFFCSRTHSQLSQFIGELQRTSFSSTLRAVSLGSRKNLCNNSEVSKLGSAARINDRCLELQGEKHNTKSGTKIQSVGPQKTQRKSSTKGCPMMAKQKLQRRFVDEALQGEKTLDIEDLIDLGSKLGTCPYYGSRRMVPTADLVVLPYQSLLHSATRESLGINLKDSVVVIDEAHNLVDTVSNIYSCQVSDSQLKQVNAQLSEYLEKFRKRLAANNRRYIEMMLGIIRSFIRLLANSTTGTQAKDNSTVGNGAAGKGNNKGKMMTINDFLFSLEIDNLNLFKIRRYIKDSNIVHKVSSYGEKYLTELTAVTPNGTNSKPSSGRVSLTGFHTLAEFVLALTNADTDGRVLVMPGATRGADGFLKFIMLNAAKHFAEVLDQARAVVLAGGTLQPVEELRVRLFPHLPEDRVHMFGCGHIVPPESILPLAIARGPSNQTFDFTYQSRSSPLVMEELGRLINNISAIVPDGIVVFFPSFEYENQVYNCWKSSTVLTTIEARKTVFREPRDATSVEATLQQYRESILAQLQDGKRTGALLLCVVGGKMSEGINFSDGMGRCVVMVGLPYPSPSDPELMERMKYIDHVSGPQVGRSGQKGREYYENLCMKAVNQSIGRAIRHIGDYAAILLVDVRYTSELSSSSRRGVESGPASKLPGWIKERFQVTGRFGEVHKLLHQFFKYNKTKGSEVKF